jgi:hypothetical protein
MSTETGTDAVARPRRRRWLAAGLVAAGVVVAVLAVAVFEVQTLFTDDEVAEAAPTFASGADAAGATDGTVTTATSGSVDATPTTAPATTPPPVVEAVGAGTFEGRVHAGEGSVVLLSDGRQTFVRFEEDFSTDNGPDLYAVAVVAGERVELGRLKGNEGSQNYELPGSIDPAAVEAVQVWCKRFDVTFTEAAIA